MLKVEAIVHVKSRSFLRLSNIFSELVHDPKVRGSSDPIPRRVEVLPDSRWQVLIGYCDSAVIPRREGRECLGQEDRGYRRRLSKSEIVIEYVVRKLE